MVRIALPPFVWLLLIVAFAGCGGDEKSADTTTARETAPSSATTTDDQSGVESAEKFIKQADAICERRNPALDALNDRLRAATSGDQIAAVNCQRRHQPGRGRPEGVRGA